MATYLFKSTQSKDARNFRGVKHINQVVNYLIEKSCISNDERIDCTRKICNLLVEDNKRFCSPKRILHFDKCWSFCDRATLADNVLVAAIHCKYSSFAETLILEGAKNHQTRIGTALALAFQHSNFKLMAQLILQDKTRNYYGEEIFIAAKNGNHLAVQLVLDMFRRTEKEPIHYLLAIQGAAAGGRLDIIRFLVERATSHRLLLKKNTILIHWDRRHTKHIGHIISESASKYRQSEMVEFALKLVVKHPFGAVPRLPYPGPDGFSHACREGYKDIVLMFLDRIPSKMSSEALYILSRGLCSAIKRGWYQIVQEILKRNVLNDKPEEIKKQLLCAVRYEQIDIVKLILLEWKSELKNSPQVCEDAYSLASSRGYTTIVHLMEEHNDLFPLSNWSQRENIDTSKMGLCNG
jgi:hypothetical protein